MEQNQRIEYEHVILPVDYNESFLNFSLQEIQNYYNWFSSVRVKRLDHLCKYLLPNSENCLKEDNLNVIEIFLLNSVEVVPKPNYLIIEELKKIPKQLQVFVTPDKYIISNKTISICYDIGIFLGELMIQLDNNIKWNLQKDDNYADFGQIILEKKHVKLKLNSFRVVKNLAAKIYEKEYIEGELFNVFNAWKRGYKLPS